MRIHLFLFGALVLASCSHASAPMPFPAGGASSSISAAHVKHPFSRGPREGAYTPLYSFQGYPIDAGGPNQLFAWNGELIGTSYNGGIASSDPSKDCQCGTVFVALGESEDVNYTFPGPTGAGYASTGANPDSGLILARHKLWGTAQYGGDSGLGTVFNIDSDGNVGLAYAFDDQGDAANPTSTLYFSKDALYGTGMHGGKYGDGAVFVLDYGKDKETPLYSFKGSDGLFPQTGLTPLPGTHLKNALFGVAGHGGANGFGAVYEINETGTIEATLYSFKGGRDGAYPTGLIAYDGKLYGVTAGGGTGCKADGGCGTIFEIDATGKETVLYRFTGGKKDGEEPEAAPVAYQDHLFGTTSHGGKVSTGTVYEFAPETNTETVLYEFKGGHDGAFPSTGLVELDGKLYGTTGLGGAYGVGTIFEIVP